MERTPDASRPVPGQRLRFTWPPAGADLEARASRRAGESVRARKIKVLARTLLYFLIMRFNITVGGFIPAKYTRELIDNSDFRKFDDALRMVLDCTPALADEIEQHLKDCAGKNIVRYGTHRQSAAMMTCFTPSPTPLQPRAFHRRRDGRLCDGGECDEEFGFDFRSPATTWLGIADNTEDAPMSKATAVLKPGEPVTLPPAGNISFEIEPGQRFKLTQPQGEQVADLVSFNRDDPREMLSMLCSRAVNLSYKFTAPMTLYSNLSREMWKIDEDMTGENYCGGGYCSEHMNMRRYGDKAKGQPNCQQNLENAIRGYGMDRWNFNVDACFNVFMTVAYDADGKWEIRLPKGKPGDFITMTALMPQIVAISNCPILFNACNNYRLKPLTWRY